MALCDAAKTHVRCPCGQNSRRGRPRAFPSPLSSVNKKRSGKSGTCRTPSSSPPVSPSLLSGRGLPDQGAPRAQRPKYCGSPEQAPFAPSSLLPPSVPGETHAPGAHEGNMAVEGKGVDKAIPLRPLAPHATMQCGVSGEARSVTRLSPSTPPVAPYSTFSDMHPCAGKFALLDCHSARDQAQRAPPIVWFSISSALSSIWCLGTPAASTPRSVPHPTYVVYLGT